MVPAVAATAMVTARSVLPDSTAVTVAMPPFSEIGLRDSARVATGRVSSSVSATATSAGAARRPCPPATVARSATLRSSPGS